MEALPRGCFGSNRFPNGKETVANRKQHGQKQNTHEEVEYCAGFEATRSQRRRNGAVSRHIETIFEEADTNHDGSVEIDEAYTLVLKMYVHINRQAPVPPPTPAEVQKAFETADADRDGRLDRSEFRRLMLFFYARNSTRIIVFRAFRHLLAPLLAFQTFATVSWIRSSRDFPDFVFLENIPYIAQRYDVNQLWKTATVVVYSAFLGHIALHIVDVFLGKFELPAEQRKSQKRGFPSLSAWPR